MKPKNICPLTGHNLRAPALPLGGIGTGSIAIGGNGMLKQWQITNTVKHLAFVPNSFFAIWAKVSGDPLEKAIVKALICPTAGDDPNFVPAEMVNDHILGVGAAQMASILPGVENIEFNGEYPIAFLRYIEPTLPIKISLTAFTPFIPLDPKNSGLPLIAFTFTLSNPLELPVDFSLVGSLQNFLGWTGLDAYKGNSYRYFGGNLNKLKKIKGWTGIEMKSEMLVKNDPRYGDLCLTVDQETSNISEQWDDLGEFWAHFAQNGTLLSSKSPDPSPIGQTWAGSLGVSQTLAPGESRAITFLMAWNFPNRVVDWNKGRMSVPDENTEFWVGNRYSEWFKNSHAVIKYFQEHQAWLTEKTGQFHEAMFSTTLPPEVLTSLTAPLSTIRSPTCLWIKDGSFHGFEGCNGAATPGAVGGSCPLDCTHVWNYEFSISRLFPSLEMTLRDTDLRLQNADGLLQHRAIIPLYLPQDGYNWEKLPPAVDGMLGTILKTYREFLNCPDETFLARQWKMLDRLLQYIFKALDPEKRGVIEGFQPNTYDCILLGLNPIIGTLYLAALLACEQMAIRLDLPEGGVVYRRMYESGCVILDQECWNGEYYHQKLPTVKEGVAQNELRMQFGRGCHSDQLVGQWWAFVLGFGYILPPDHVKTAVKSIIKYNHKETLEGIEQMRIFASSCDGGLLNCTWPHGGQPNEPMRYTNEVWTGIEYEVAALSAYTGQIDSALTIIRSLRKRYDGSRRNPWNEIEYGDHYARALSSWTLLHAFTGIEYNEEKKHLSIASKGTLADFQSFFCTYSAWGLIKIDLTPQKLRCTLAIAYGEVDLRSVTLTFPGRVLFSDTGVITDKKGQLTCQIVSMPVQEGRQIVINFSDVVSIDDECEIAVRHSG